MESFTSFVAFDKYTSYLQETNIDVGSRADFTPTDKLTMYLGDGVIE